jgi:NAD(P)-dependent dehydrogenase (short-subunit alcohol dehydrogenase family)
MWTTASKTDADDCRYQKRIPTGTFAEPEEVAHVVNMLVQDLACNINGADFRIDGGFTIQ